MKLLPSFLFALFTVQLALTAVKDSDFKRCDQSGFCTRNRAVADLGPLHSYAVDESSLVWQPELGIIKGMVKKQLMDGSPSSIVQLYLLISLHENDIVRVQLDEHDSQLAKRYRVKDVLIEEGSSFTATPFTYEKSSSNGFILKYGKSNSAYLQLNPFALDVVVESVPLVSINRKGWLNFEEYRKRPMDDTSSQTTPTSSTSESPEVSVSDHLISEPAADNTDHRLVNMWEETFNGNTDSKKNGPSSIGFDATLIGFEHTYGIPEHASSLVLKETRNASYSDPYRLYNLDVFEFDLDRNTALYGSVPYMIGHKVDKKTSQAFSAGIFWLNAAEMWIDVTKESSPGHLINQDQPSESVSNENGVSTMTHWIAESGILDLFIMTGKSPKHISELYSTLTGSQNLPALFALGYHQCRWNYMDTGEVSQVVDGLEKHDIAADVIWLDIEHTDDKRYFTWHPKKFEDPSKMFDEVASKGRKMVTIIDPHIKRDDNYYVKKSASERGLFIRNKDGAEFDGWCWPGSSSWIDYTSPKAREFWSKLFSYDQYKFSNPNLFTWNDMNEPSVFTGPEITMPKDNLHYGDVEHRDIHNIYGMLLHRATYGGHIYRSLPSHDGDTLKWKGDFSALAQPHRPFVLSRAFFAGTQRYGAIWTGDNMAKWDHLASSAPMLLSISMAGIGFCGVDVGGFFFNPAPELLTRWYQAGIFYPFFRAHAHLETKRREPWLLGEPYLSIIREAIKTRYQLLPYWYTLFRHGQMRGVSPMRPLFVEFPDQGSLFAVDDQYMVGSALMVKPIVTDPGNENSNSMSVLLPGSEPWFDFYSSVAYSGTSHTFDNRQLSSPVPLLMRAGKVIPIRARYRRTSQASLRDPISLIVTLDSSGKASGDWYLDDGNSFSYAVRGEFVHQKITVEVNGKSIKLKANNWLYDNADANIESKVRKMKPWQRPFLGDSLTSDNGDVITDWNNAQNNMNFMSNSKFRKAVNEDIHIESIKIIGLDDSVLGKWSSDKVTSAVKTFSVGTDPSEEASLNFSNLIFETVKSGSSSEKSTRILTIKKPELGAGVDFELVISQ